MSEFDRVRNEGQTRYGALWTAVNKEIMAIARRNSMNMAQEPLRTLLAHIALRWCANQDDLERKLALARGNPAAAVEGAPSSWEPPERRHVPLDKGAHTMDMDSTLAPSSVPDADEGRAE